MHAGVPFECAVPTINCDNYSMPLIVFNCYIDFVQDLFKTVHFAEKGTSQRVKEEATFMLFENLLNSCEGTCHIFTMCMHVTWFGTWHFVYILVTHHLGNGQHLAV